MASTGRIVYYEIWEGFFVLPFPVEADQGDWMAQMSVDVEPRLADLYRAQREVEAYLAEQSKALDRFIKPDGLIHRVVDAGTRGESSRTCSAFSLYYLLRAGLVERDGAGTSVLSRVQAEKAATKLGRQLPKATPTPGTARAPSTTTSTLPNQYNSSIYLAGYGLSCRELGLPATPEVLAACDRIGAWLLDHVGENRGYASRLENRETPSAYLTFWAAEALRHWQDLRTLHPLVPAAAGSGSTRRRRTGRTTGHRAPVGATSLTASDAGPHVLIIARWAESELASQIAFHEARLFGRFDVIELIYAALTCLAANPTPERVRLADSGLAITFKHYFNNGCFTPSTPVIADRRNFSLLCPTAEALALITTIAPFTIHSRWGELIEVYRWLREHRHHDGGWHSEWDGRRTVPNAFMTSSTLTYLAGLARVLDEVLNSEAAAALGVEPFVQDPKLADYSYPTEVAGVIQSHVIQPRKNAKLGHLAAFSMILYGPPGSSKTTLAKKLAQDLGWPLLVINQSEFLREGMERLDAVAGLLFTLVGYLRNTVVLFDEVEELVQARAADDRSAERADKLSRLLTTSMLPRVADLRDRKRIVFIFNTNHVSTIDVAIARLGRFDIVRCVLPPTAVERKKIMTSLVKKANLPLPAQAALTDDKFVKKTEHFGFADLSDLVRRIGVEILVDAKTFNEAMLEAAIKVGERAVNAELVERFKKLSRTGDRP